MKRNYSKNLHCEKCGIPVSDKSMALCRICNNQLRWSYLRVEISPWRVIEDGVLVRTVECR